MTGNKWSDRLLAFLVSSLLVLMVLDSFDRLTPPPVHAAVAFAPRVCTQFTPISLTAAAQIIPTQASNVFIYICAVQYGTGGTAETGSIVEGTTTTTPCDTGTAALSGGTTAATGGPIGASPVQSGSGTGWIFKTKTAGDKVCMLVSGASQVGGFITWDVDTF